VSFDLSGSRCRSPQKVAGKVQDTSVISWH
jgi:hypothetical protein